MDRKRRLQCVPSGSRAPVIHVADETNGDVKPFRNRPGDPRPGRLLARLPLEPVNERRRGLCHIRRQIDCDKQAHGYCNMRRTMSNAACDA